MKTELYGHVLRVFWDCSPVAMQGTYVAKRSPEILRKSALNIEFYVYFKSGATS